MNNDDLSILVFYKDIPFDPNKHVIVGLYDIQEAINVIQEYCQHRDFKVEEKIILKYKENNILELNPEAISSNIFVDEFQLFAIFDSNGLIEKSGGYYNFPQIGWTNTVTVKKYPHYFKILMKSDTSDEIPDKEVKRRIKAIFKDFCNRSLNQYIQLEPGILVNYFEIEKLDILKQEHIEKIFNIVRDVRKVEARYENDINNIEDPLELYDLYTQGPGELFNILQKYNITRPTEFQGEQI